MNFSSPNYVLTRFIFQRALGFIYFVGFLIIVNQFRALCGEHGILPAKLFLRRIEFLDAPSLLWFNSSDLWMAIWAWIGVGLSVMALTGLSDMFTGALGRGVSIFIWSS